MVVRGTLGSRYRLVFCVCGGGGGGEEVLFCCWFWGPLGGCLLGLGLRLGRRGGDGSAAVVEGRLGFIFSSVWYCIVLYCIYDEMRGWIYLHTPPVSIMSSPFLDTFPLGPVVPLLFDISEEPWR